jgi:hypothetical protein
MLCLTVLAAFSPAPGSSLRPRSALPLPFPSGPSSCLLLPDPSRILPARPAGALSAGGRTDSHDRTSRPNIASSLTNPCRPCRSENVAHTSFAASARSVAARSRPFALASPFLSVFPALRFHLPRPGSSPDPRMAWSPPVVPPMPPECPGSCPMRPAGALFCRRAHGFPRSHIAT